MSSAEDAWRWAGRTGYGTRDGGGRRGDRPRRDRTVGQFGVQQAGRERNRSRRRGDRSFPPDNGTVDGQPAFVQQQGDRTVAYHGDGHEGKVVTNDGLNASYIRDADGHVPVDDGTADPYDGYNTFDDWHYRR